MEFQAVVMAGGQGSRMMDLTATVPKALLPVANMPLIWYPVHMLEKAGFAEALVVVQDSSQASIQKALEQICDVKIKLDFVVIPDEEDWGTADSLRHIKDKVKNDLLVVSCDLITDLPLHLLADLHRTHDSTLTMLLAPAPDLTEVSVPGGKANKTVERDIVGLDEKGSRVLFVASEADLDDDITFKKSFLKKYPVVNLKTQLMDAHLYLMKKCVVDYLVENSSLSRVKTIKGELIPHLVRKQFRRNRPTPGDKDLSLNVTSAPDNKLDIQTCTEEDTFAKLAQEYSSWNDHHGDMRECYRGDKMRCYALIPSGTFCLRVNTLVTYCEANRHVPRELQTLAPGRDLPLVHPTVGVPQRSTVGADSMMGEGSSVGERSGVKRSIIGKHCVLSDKVKVTNSIIMDHVTIAEGSSVSGCVVCDNAHIGEKAELKDCLVASGQNILPMGKFTNEVLTDIDHMMEVE